MMKNLYELNTNPLIIGEEPPLFVKLTLDRNHEIVRFIFENPEYLLIFYKIALRVRRSDNTSLNLKKGEFILSIYECNKFDCSYSTLRRRVNKLIKLGIIKKMKHKTGYKGCNVYKVITNNFIGWTFGTETKSETSKNQTKKQGWTHTKKVKNKESKERFNFGSGYHTPKEVIDEKHKIKTSPEVIKKTREKWERDKLSKRISNDLDN